MPKNYAVKIKTEDLNDAGKWIKIEHEVEFRKLTEDDIEAVELELPGDVTGTPTLYTTKLARRSIVSCKVDGKDVQPSLEVITEVMTRHPYFRNLSN